MKTDLYTVLNTPCVHLDDRTIPELGFTKRGRPWWPPSLTDIELLCLVIAQHLLGIALDRRWIRYANTHLRSLFPTTPGM